MKSYSKIVFGLKHHQRLSDCTQFMELIHTLHIIISEHDAVTDRCERPGLHYHGIIEHAADTIIINNDVIKLLIKNCSYFKKEKCNSPQQFVAYLAQPPKKLMVLEIWKSDTLATNYSKIPDFAQFSLELGSFEKELSKMEDIELIEKHILNKRTFDPDKIYKQIEESDDYVSSPDELKTLVVKTVTLVQKKLLDLSILELRNVFIKEPENYYTIIETTDLIIEWCQYQNIDLEAFTKNWVRCLDKKVPNKNTLYFQGSPESGVNAIIDSIVACCSTGEIDNESTGFSYFWDECVDKRCIIIRDPDFHECEFENLKKVLNGKGTLVCHRQNIKEYIRPTPVVLLSNKNDQEHDLFIQRLQNSFIQCYLNLKPFTKLLNGSRLLHPDWLYELYQHFNNFGVNYIADCSKDMKISQDADLSGGEDGLVSPIGSVSSTTPFIGTPNPGCSQDL